MTELVFAWPPKELSPKPRRFWSDVEIELIKERYSNGRYVDVASLALKLNRSKYSLHMKASRLGLGNSSRAKCVERKKKINKFNSPKEVAANMSAIQKALIEKNGHPRRMLGKHHSKSSKEAISLAASKMNANRTPEQKIQYLIKAMKTKQRNGTYAMPRVGTSWKAGWREIGGVSKYYRSKWEANYAHYLQWLKEKRQIKDWKHEPKTFWFEGVKRGTVSYLPDFWVQEMDGSESFHEVKGWMDDRSKTKISRMSKYYPEVKLVVIDSKGYEALKKSVKGLIEGWEE